MWWVGLKCVIVVFPGQTLFLLCGNCSQLHDGGGGGDEEKKSSENDQLTGHFQDFFFLISPEQTVILVR